MTYIISQTDMEALLGRPLSTIERKNYQLYLEIATERLVSLLCLPETPTEITDIRMKNLLAHIFGVQMDEAEYTKRNGIEAKQVEDFRVTYDKEAETPMEVLVKNYASDIAALTQCKGKIRSGKVCNGYRFYPI